MRLTARGVRLVAIAVALVVGGELLGYPLLRMLGGAAAGAVLLALALVGRPPRVRVQRTLFPERVTRGSPALASLVLHEDAGTRQPGFHAVDHAGDTAVAIAVRGLAARASATYHYELPTERRGRLPIGPLEFTRGDPLGLAARRVTVGTPATLWVHPRRHPVHPSLGVHPRHHHEGALADPPLRGSMDLRRLREYVVGDEPRHLHWKATARSGQLMVREYLDPSQPRFTLLLDTREDVLDPNGFEDAVEVSASLLCAALAAGHRVRLCTSAGSTLEATTQRDLLDRLCVLDRHRGALDRTLLHRTVVRTATGGALAVVTGAAGIELATLPGLAAAYRDRTVFAPGAAGASGAVLIGESDPALAVRAWNSQRRVR